MSKKPNNLFHHHPKALFYSEKNTKNLYKILSSDRKYYIFNCNCGHEFTTAPYFIINRDYWCGYCGLNPRYICGKSECKPCFERSFASHPKSKFWSIKNENQPYHYLKTSISKCLFNCDCGHEINKCIKDIDIKDSWCGYCCRTPRHLCDKDDCNNCFNNSFASHPKSEFWSNKNIKTARQCMKSAGSKYIFNCVCGHEIIKSLNKISSNNQWCEYCCTSTRKLCDKEECNHCYNNSLASHYRAKRWSLKNNDTPRNIMKYSGEKRWFKCEYEHEFCSRINSITDQNSWCPVCKNKTEKKLYEYLIDIYPDVIKEAKFDWCKSAKGNYLRFDFCLPDLKIIIELDGIQHFEDVLHFNSFAKINQQNDAFKMQCALDNNFKVIRIYQPDVFNKYIDWETALTEAINENGNNYYLAEFSDIYDPLIDLMNDIQI